VAFDKSRAKVTRVNQGKKRKNKNKKKPLFLEQFKNPQGSKNKKLNLTPLYRLMSKDTYN